MRAAEEAGYSAASAAGQATRLLKNAQVLARVEELREQAVRAAGVDACRVREELARVAFSRISDVLRAGPDGKTGLVPFEELPDGVIAAVSEIENVFGKVNKLRVRMYDKLRALELLGRDLGMFKEAEGPVEKVVDVLRAMLLADGHSESA